MSGNLKEQVKGCQKLRIRHSYETEAVSMAQRHNWDLCCDAPHGAGGQVVQAGLREDLIRVTLPPEAGPGSKGRPFPREDSVPQGGRRPGSRSQGAPCIRGWAPSIFPIVSSSHSMSNFTL